MLNVTDLSKHYGESAVFSHVHLQVAPGEFVAILGESGVGKSTLLNCIAGLLEVSDGQIFIKGKNVTWEEPKDRGIGMVFQSYALYPQMTVEKNLSFGLRVSGMRPVESSAPIGGPSISGGEKGNGVAGNGAGVENEGVNGGCAQPPFSRVPSYHVLDAAIDATHRWLVDGVAPPSAPPIELKQLPASSIPPSAEIGRGQTGPRWEIVRDEMGLARGGIRLAAVAVPIAKNTGDNVGSVGVATGGGERNCRLMGSWEPFDAARLTALYSAHDAYVGKVREATEKNLKAVYITKWDADATIRDAENSKIGR